MGEAALDEKELTGTTPTRTLSWATAAG